jgi:hypothetical protein
MAEDGRRPGRPPQGERVPQRVMTIQMPEDMHVWIHGRAFRTSSPSVAQYIRGLIEADRKKEESQLARAK